MAYLFITGADLEEAIQEKLLTANSQQGDSLTNNTLIEGIERKQIVYITAKLNSRYDMQAAFAKAGDDRNGVLLEILVRLVLYKFLKRNAARKVTEDVRKDYEDAMKELKEIQKGETYPGLAEYKEDNGEVTDLPIYSNSTNPNNYI